VFGSLIDCMDFGSRMVRIQFGFVPCRFSGQFLEVNAGCVIKDCVLLDCTNGIVVLIIYLPCCCFQILSFVVPFIISLHGGARVIHRLRIGGEYSH
jgi:hypothetical protein